MRHAAPETSYSSSSLTLSDSYEFARYEPATADVQAKVIEESDKVKDEDE